MQQEYKISFRSGEHHHAAIATEKETLLQAGLRQQVPLNYHCSSGSCGACKAWLVQGDLRVYSGVDCQHISHQHDVLSTRHEVHLCQSYAVSDCIVEAVFDGNAAPPELETPRHFSALLKGVQQLGSGLYRLSVDLDDTMYFLPGQYVMLEIEGLPGARAYSIANFANGTSHLQFILTCVPSGLISSRLCNVENIDIPLRAYGPLGKAYVYPKNDKDLVMLVGGSGVSVALSALEWAISSNYLAQQQLTIFWGVRDTSASSLLEKLDFHAQAYANIHIGICSDISPSDDDSRQFYSSNLFTGYPANHAADSQAINWERSEVYISGPPAMVDYTVRQLLMTVDVDPADIKCDSFF